MKCRYFVFTWWGRFAACQLDTTKNSYSVRHNQIHTFENAQDVRTKQVLLEQIYLALLSVAYMYMYKTF